MRTLVLGGYGNFGARLSRALAAQPSIEVAVAGRDGARARRFAAGLGPRCTGLALDTADPAFPAALAAARPDLVIHTAGPFQPQGHAVPLAVAAVGAHYLDLADGRRFVCDFVAATDAAFRRAGRSAVTGASSLPGLSSAAVDALSDGWRAVETVDIAIAPAQTAPRGLATLAGVLASCGEPVQVWDGGRWQTRRGWADPVPVHVVGLAPRLGAICDVPDLELLPLRHPLLERATFRAALEVTLAQRAFAALAAARAAGWVHRPERLAPWLHRAGRVLDRFGSALGGMVVRVSGRDAEDRRVARSWHLLGPDDHGPEIPCMPAALLARRLAAGGTLPLGANVCQGLLALADFAPEFARWGMRTVICDETPPAAPP